MLREGDLVLVDAPLCLECERAFLCDLPNFVRRPGDPELRLTMSEAAGAELRLGDFGPWFPFCRTLGIMQHRASGLALEVLQISLRLLRFPNATWSTHLIEEAHAMKYHRAYYDDDNVFVSSWISDYRSEVQQAREKHQLDASGFAVACGPDFARKVLRERSVEYYVKIANSPYGNTEGFWTVLAALLPSWRGRFPLREAEGDALLRAFDDSYDNAWKTSFADLALTGLFRFTPAVMETIRGRIHALRTPLKAACPSLIHQSLGAGSAAGHRDG